MEPLIKESTNRLAEKICTIAENGEVVDALQYVMQLSVCEYTVRVVVWMRSREEMV